VSLSTGEVPFNDTKGNPRDTTQWLQH